MPTLNDAQREAVTEGGGHALVLAGAGAGKTRVIVERIAWLIGERGVNPRNILALTFTNRAAAEMKARVAERLDMGSVSCWVGTFHAFGAHLLRRHIDLLGRSKSFNVFDATDQRSLMKRLVRELESGYPKVLPRRALWWISQHKQRLEEPGPAADLRSGEDGAYRVLWARYHEALARAGAVDFDDLLVLPCRLFEKAPDVLNRYQGRYRHILVDEYQDTNRAQYVMVKRLSQGHGNLFVVGDEDQGIYSWRGATLNNILDFERDFPDARIFRLEQNYRSTQSILRVANALVSNNAHRLGKTLWTEQTGGEKVRLFKARDAEEEARFVANDIASSKASPSDVAVLYRTNAQSRLLEEALRTKKTPYVVVGSVSFYARKEIKDLLAYLRLVAQPADDEALRRIINVPARGIGSTTVRHLEEYAATRGAALLEVLREVEHDQTLGPRARRSITEFVHVVDDLAHMARTASVKGVVTSLLDRTQYRAFVAKADDAEATARAEVVDEFVSACASFDQDGEGGLTKFLEQLALISDVDGWDSSAPAVTLMTCHAAKGLEFKCVYLVGLEDGLLPHGSALDSERGIEEERRLCYVAMTRAREQLTLSHAGSRLVYGERQKVRPSRFIEEIPGEYMTPVGTNASAPRRSGATVARPEPPRAKGGLQRGTVVRHASFGTGKVMQTMGSGAKMRARIRFQSGRSRTFLVSAAPLEILKGGD